MNLTKEEIDEFAKDYQETLNARKYLTTKLNAMKATMIDEAFPAAALNMQGTYMVVGNDWRLEIEVKEKMAIDVAKVDALFGVDRPPEIRFKAELDVVAYRNATNEQADRINRCAEPEPKIEREFRVERN